MKKYHFSRRHWMNIILCFLLFVLNNACTTDGENVILPRLAQANGWDYAQILMWASIAGVLSVLGQFLIGKMCAKRGAKFTIITCMIAAAVFLLLYGSANVMWLYAIGLFGVVCCSTSFSYIGGSALIANWFPRKKGIAMGFVSIGAPVSTIVMVSLLTMLIDKIGLFHGVMIISIVVVVVAIVCGFLLQDRPEMCGETPDNMSVEEMQQFVLAEEGEEKLSLKELLFCKDFWRIVFIMGSCSIALTGVMAQFVVRLTDSGFAEPQAIQMMSVCAVIGIFGSLFSGNLENRFGTKKAYLCCATVFIAALLINATNIPVLIFISIPLFGMVITILQIFLTSFEVSVFGRKNFEQSNAVIFPLVSMIGQLCFVIISVCIKLFGQIRYAYFVFAGLLIVSLFVSQRIKIANYTEDC